MALNFDKNKKKRMDEKEWLFVVRALCFYVSSGTRKVDTPDTRMLLINKTRMNKCEC